MRQYQVLSQCYVPVGPGFKYKFPGQVVTLDDEDAASLEGLIAPVAGVQELNTQRIQEQLRDAKVDDGQEAFPFGQPEEVAPDGSESQTADGRAVHEAGQ